MPDQETDALSTNPRASASTAVFRTTQWTQVLAARGDSEPARLALSDLCAAYYDPVNTFLIRTGHDSAEARELAHDFFTSLLGRDSLANVRREGRFRSYLLGALKHFLSNRAARDQRAKRGGGMQPMPLNARHGHLPRSALARSAGYARPMPSMIVSGPLRSWTAP